MKLLDDTTHMHASFQRIQISNQFNALIIIWGRGTRWEVVIITCTFQYINSRAWKHGRGKWRPVVGSGAKTSLWENNEARVVCITWEDEGPTLPEAGTTGWRAQVSCMEEMRPSGPVSILACAHLRVSGSRHRRCELGWPGEWHGAKDMDFLSENCTCLGIYSASSS